MVVALPNLYSCSSGPCRQLEAVVLLIACLLASCAHAYTGFDCGQGNALLYLVGHSKCGLGSQLACYQTLGMKVKGCQVKLWPHKPKNQPRRPCWGVSVHANVTDINHAEGTLVGPVQGSGRSTVPAAVEFSRPDESMHVRFGACVLDFEVQAASDAALQPIPGEDSVPVSSLLALLLPAVLVPCVVVSLVVAAGSITTVRPSGASGKRDGFSDTSGVHYSRLPSGGSSGDSRAGPGITIPGLNLLTQNFNFKAMSRRARARRLRRSTRVVYVGPAESSVEQHLLYASGRLQPGPQNLVAPCFRFPPIAVPPGLPAIPESCTPTDASAVTSRSSSCQDLGVAAAASGPGLRFQAAGTVLHSGPSSTATKSSSCSGAADAAERVVCISSCDMAVSRVPATAGGQLEAAEQHFGHRAGQQFGGGGSSCAWFPSGPAPSGGTRAL